MGICFQALTLCFFPVALFLRHYSYRCWCLIFVAAIVVGVLSSLQLETTPAHKPSTRDHENGESTNEDSMGGDEINSGLLFRNLPSLDGLRLLSLFATARSPASRFVARSFGHFVIKMAGTPLICHRS